METREAEPTQEELFTGRYLKLIDEHQSLQQIHAKTWAENERRKLVMEEMEAALVMVMRRASLPEVLLHKRDEDEARAWELQRETVRGSVLFRLKRKGEG